MWRFRCYELVSDLIVSNAMLATVCVELPEFYRRGGVELTSRSCWVSLQLQYLLFDNDSSVKIIFWWGYRRTDGFVRAFSNHSLRE